MDINFFGLSPLEIILIMVVALIVFGPDKLPQFARTAGKYVNEFRKMSQEVRTQVSRELTLDLKDQDGKTIGLEQYIVKVRDEVKGAFSDVTSTITSETAAVKSALTIDPNLLKNVVSDNITTTVISNPGTPQAETLVSRVEPTSEIAPLNLPAYFTSNPEPQILPTPVMHTTRIHYLQLNNAPSTFSPVSSVPTVQVEAATFRDNQPNLETEIVKEGMPFSEYEKTFGSYDMVDLGAVAAADGGSPESVTSRKPRISKRGGYAGSRANK